MTELTVAMPVLDCGPWVEQAVRSVLAQQGIDFELIVVDDGSRDDSAAIVASIRDPRLRLLRHERTRGIGACHNRVLAESTSPFVAQVDADDFLLPGALRAMVDALLGNPAAGQAHCWYLKVDAQGRIGRERFVERLRELRRKRMPGLDYRRELVRRGMVANHLRTYRRSALDELGGFDERLDYFDDYEMSLRIIGRHAIAVVPRFYYCWREHGTSTTGSLRWRSLRYAWRRWRVLVRHRRRADAAWMDTVGVPLWQPWRTFLLEQGVRPLRTAARGLRDAPRRALSPPRGAAPGQRPGRPGRDSRRFSGGGRCPDPPVPPPPTGRADRACTTCRCSRC